MGECLARGCDGSTFRGSYEGLSVCVKVRFGGSICGIGTLIGTATALATAAARDGGHGGMCHQVCHGLH